MTEFAKKKEPPRELPPKKGFCPKCGAYVGGYYACPWCRTKMAHGTRLRITQYVSIFAVIAGIIGLGIYARLDPAPLVNIGDIGPTYSNGVVTIQGEVTNIDLREASDGSWKTLYFTVTDSTGSIVVKAYTETTDEMITAHNTPAMGDDCTVRGTVYIRGDEMYILLDNSAYFIYDRPAALSVNATQLFDLYNNTPSDYLGIRVKVTGNVTEVGGDDTYFELDNLIRIYFPDYVRAFSPDVSISVIAGDTVEVIGITEIYYNTLQVLPGSMYDITITNSEGGQE